METSVSSNPKVVSKHLNMKIFFTIKTGQNIGFTHQLSSFNAFYKLGTHLGFEYLHTSFSTSRSSKAIHKFIGFNRHFNVGEYIFCSSLINRIRVLIAFCKYRTVFIRLQHDPALSKASLNNFEGLLKHIRTVTNCNSQRPILVRFSGKNRTVYHWIHSNIGCPQPPVDLRSTYFSSRALDPWQSRFQPNSIKILIHIRQGDTALIPTPWNTFIDTQRLREIKTANLSGARFTDTDEYLHFLKLLIDEISPQKYSVVVCSDGYKRGFRKIYKNKNSLGLSAGQVKQLKNLGYSFDAEKFKPFTKISNCFSVIGESDPNLFDLTHSAMLADLIVYGDQQIMMPDLMANYADNLNPPILVRLHNREIAKDYDPTGLSGTTIKLTSINMRNKNNDLIKQVSKDLIEKWKRSQ